MKRRTVKHHDTTVKFIGIGYRAKCTTPGCNFLGPLHQYHGNWVLMHRAERQAEDDAREHKRNMERRARKEDS